ncbi:glucose-6-phosphate isomerase [Roseovarius sp. A21]|uniref:Glucose-6-phosphate isomerase n=1 Tax=Roseovarius bejariae TaxID=2576383 RepID=A0A844D4V6_9RHOB|nr:glucose-6-phosphate isomerase [Roseovarius bejariae]MRU16318.1 glucose-6-phosphate isomerase [Roseovarius bejariae]
MRQTFLGLAVAAVFGLTACEDMTREESMVVGGLTGAALGVVTADALGADSDWKIITGLAGAAAGVLVAQNRHRNRCAYARGDGTYLVRRCP